MKDLHYPNEWDTYSNGIWRQIKKSKDIENKELIALRQDLNIVAQHIVAIRNEVRERIQVISETADEFEQVTKKVLENVIDKVVELECRINSSDLSKHCTEFGIKEQDK